MNGLIFEALKRTLKAKGITYRVLAERMGVSEPTVKRIFHERNCKLDRLMEICTAAGVELENVLGSITEDQDPPTRSRRRSSARSPGGRHCCSSLSCFPRNSRPKASCAHKG
ncbi:helix-turn-helix transcriptional regulator [Mesorhizobium sp. M1273]|uniref:helix-turn-helix domain-containing protein n=1 Tax=Mesorhizobium sp. M1273 TaxID=2957075 RepID=UPI00333C0509